MLANRFEEVSDELFWVLQVAHVEGGALEIRLKVDAAVAVGCFLIWERTNGARHVLVNFDCDYPLSLHLRFFLLSACLLHCKHAKLIAMSKIHAERSFCIFAKKSNNS